MKHVKSIWKKAKAEAAIWSVGALPGIAVIGLVVFARLVGSLQGLEWTALDHFLRWRPAEPVDQRIVIVGINETDIRRVGSYPIPDRNIAALLRKLQTYKPAAIGLDIFRDLPVEPGHADLVNVFRDTKNLIVIDKFPSLNSIGVNPPPSLPLKQVGFADAILDSDGYLRRSLLGSHDSDNRYRFSLTVKLAETYLATQGIFLDNGFRDPIAMRFGNTELTRFQANSGSYVNADAGGNQILINFRSGQHPFRHLSLSDIENGTVDPNLIRGRIVLVGITAPSVKDIINSAAIASDNPALIYGVEVQAHAISQIVSAVLDQRPLLKVWSDGWEYGWIVAWGILGISLGRFLRSPLRILFSLTGASIALVGLSYTFLILGWWVPVVPALLVLVLNGAGLTASLFYRYEQDLHTRLQERQLIIEHTFNAIHNGPLQTLAKVLSQVQDQKLKPHQFSSDLQRLNRELRTVYESVKREALVQGEHLYLGYNLELDLQAPIHEILYEVYSDVMERDFPCFKTLKVKVVKFEPINAQRLNIDQKRGLCRFLEEALCNVGKHAIGVTWLNVACIHSQGKNIVRIIDNGSGIDAISSSAHRNSGESLGTQQARNLAKQLSGKFRRYPNSPQGTVSELTWSVAKFWFWQS
jgi:CHASE2 domain-containing sensor protein